MIRGRGGNGMDENEWEVSTVVWFVRAISQANQLASPRLNV